MKTISYDLIEKLREAGSGAEAEAQILGEASDAAYLYALSPERENLLEWYPWTKDMEVLQLGAEDGAFCRLLSPRVKALDIRDERPEELEVIRFRTPELLSEKGGNVGLIRHVVVKKYDVVVIPELTEALMEQLLPKLPKKSGSTAPVRTGGIKAAAGAVSTSSIKDAPAGKPQDMRQESQRAAAFLPEFLSAAAAFLKEGGALLFLADNASALRFMTGDAYQEGRVYIEPEALSKGISALSFAEAKRYFPLPDGRFARDIFSERYLPGEGDFRGISQSFETPRYLTCDEEAMYGRLCSAGAFAAFAPAFFYVLSGFQKEPVPASGEKAAAAIREEASVTAGVPGGTAETEKAGSRKNGRLPKQIYIRYNRMRLPVYQTKTEILEENGARRVKKTALSEAGNAHIQSFDWKYGLLKKDTGTKLLVQKPDIQKEAGGVYSVSFEFLRGKTLAKTLSEEISGGRIPVAKIREAMELVLGVGAHPCHNMDCLFENVMQCGSDFYYLDYEWVFEDALDRGYLEYRMLRYFFEAYRESLYAYADLSEFLLAFGLKAEELPEFEQMEASFQQFVHGDRQALLSDRFRKKAKGLSDIRETERKLQEFTDWNLRLQDEVQEHKESLAKSIEIERLSQNHIANIEAVNRIHEADIAALEGELSYLRKHESLFSRARRGADQALLRAFPKGSRKRKVLKYIKNTLRHPVTYIGMYCTADGRNRILGDFHIGSEYLEGGRLQLPDCLHYADLFSGISGESAPEAKPEGAEDGAQAERGSASLAAGKQPETKAVPKKIRPRVSIVLPVYNQIAYTYACVRSIIQHTDFAKTPYEVILADDVSKDATAVIENYIEGLSISRNAENQGFLKNCNQAAKKALGDYIFFLNNDTKVTDGWLSSLVSMMEADESIGMAGSKLVYPDGRLQEAGGIIWSDGSGWNYGRLDDPEKPQYNYVKEADYISGAAIMIRKALWEEIGGFDERFAPAYCEDSDLAFEVRRHGKRVVYQPKSVVVHFEGVSNGTDVNGSGLKKYQLVNQKTFQEKWKTELKKQSKNTGNPNPFAARDRSQRKKCVLFIDHYVPTWDKDAGSKTTFQYIRMFLEKGWNVKFLGDNFLHEEPYTTKLLQMGVEILYGEAMQRGIWDWLKENQAFIDVAYLNRPHIAVKYIDFLRDNTEIRCIYYGHDLHFMRLMREYELNGDIRTKREADYWKSIEFSVMEKAEVSYYPSETEAAAIHAINPALPVKAITAYLWDNFPVSGGSREDYEKREGLLFVGGFAHPPNEDGVLWFAEQIFPKIRKNCPGMKFYIVGSKVTEAVEALGKDSEKTGIHVLGFVSDEELAALYQKTRLTVVPLRYGAGVKGKVVEALYHAAVVVTTSVGAEGIPEADRVLAVVNDADEEIHTEAAKVEEAFADAVVKLYDSPEALSAISMQTGAYMQEHYSMQAAWKMIEADFK